MPAKRREPAPPWQAILEEIRSQNRATIEAGEANRLVVEQRIEDLDRAMRTRFEVLEAAVRDLRDESRSRDDSLEASLKDARQESRSLEASLKELREESRSRDDSLEGSLKELRQESRSGLQSLEVAVRDLKVSVQQNSVDLRDLAGKVEALTRLEERVAALERRSA